MTDRGQGDRGLTATCRNRSNNWTASPFLPNFNGAPMTAPDGPATMERRPKQRLHQLIDELPEEQIQAAERYLHSLCRDVHPVVRAMRSAPVDDEPLTDEDREAIQEGRREIASGHGIPNERIRRKLGL